MNPIGYAARLGVARGLREFRQSVTTVSDLVWYVFVAVAFVVVLIFQRDSTVKGTDISLAFSVLPSVLGMMIAFNGMQGVAGTLAVEREDGTLLRAKAVPNGMIGYLVGRILGVSLGALLSLAIILVSALFLVPEVAETGPGGWLTFFGMVALGLLASLTWGAILGSLVTSPQVAFSITMPAFMGLAAISGIFYPIFAMPGWVQGIAQVFPVYWLGLGVRSAFLPGSAAAVEIGDSWRHLETVAVLGAWGVVGLLLAPGVLRRMARKESGSTMEARRQRALQRFS